MRGDSGTIAGTAQGRTDLDARGRFALRLCHPKPQRDPKAHPTKETEAQKRLGEEGFGKKRLLIRLRYSSYRVSPDGRGARAAQPGPARHMWGLLRLRGDTGRVTTRSVLYLHGRISPVLCLSQGKQPHPACSRGCAMSLPATKATRPHSCQREPCSGRVGAIRRQWELLLGGAGA